MSLFRPFAAAAAVIAFAGATTYAGTFFRLEIGPPIAAGIAKSKEIKKNDGKKFVLAVRPRLCDSMERVTITGTAEGLVNGSRQSIPLELIPIDPEEGIHAVLQQWPDAGQWVLQLNATCPKPKASASTLVPVNKGTFIREKTEVLPATATKQQVDAALTALARLQS